MELPSTRKKIGPRTATREHIVPKSKGGLNWKTNEVAAHFECNQKRGNAPLDPIQAARVAFILESRKCTKEADKLLESFRQKKEGP